MLKPNGADEGNVGTHTYQGRDEDDMTESEKEEEQRPNDLASEKTGVF